jgi:hypothetical protein
MGGEVLKDPGLTSLDVEHWNPDREDPDVTIDCLEPVFPCLTYTEVPSFSGLQPADEELEALFDGAETELALENSIHDYVSDDGAGGCSMESFSKLELFSQVEITWDDAIWGPQHFCGKWDDCDWEKSNQLLRTEVSGSDISRRRTKHCSGGHYYGTSQKAS